MFCSSRLSKKFFCNEYFESKALFLLFFKQNPGIGSSKNRPCPLAHAHKQYIVTYIVSEERNFSNDGALYHYEAKKAIKTVLLRPIILMFPENESKNINIYKPT